MIIQLGIVPLYMIIAISALRYVVIYIADGYKMSLPQKATPTRYFVWSGALFVESHIFTYRRTELVILPKRASTSQPIMPCISPRST